VQIREAQSWWGWNFSDIESWFWENEKLRSGTFEAFRRLQEELWDTEDAVAWIHDRYYKDDLSVKAILDLPIFVNLEFVSKATLSRILFSEYGMWWKANENTKRGLTHDKTEMLRLAWIRDTVDKLLTSNSELRTEFNMDTYTKLRYPLKKIFYILKNCWGISEEQIEKVFDRSDVSSEVLIQILNEKSRALVALHWLDLKNNFLLKKGSSLRNYFKRKLNSIAK
jgi:hypothetical protein